MQDVATKSERGRRIGQAVADTGKAVGKSGVGGRPSALGLCSVFLVQFANLTVERFSIHCRKQFAFGLALLY